MNLPSWHQLPTLGKIIRLLGINLQYVNVMFLVPHHRFNNNNFDFVRHAVSDDYQVCHMKCCIIKGKVSFQPMNTGKDTHLPLETNGPDSIFCRVGLATPPTQ